MKLRNAGSSSIAMDSCKRSEEQIRSTLTRLLTLDLCIQLWTQGRSRLKSHSTWISLICTKRHLIPCLRSASKTLRYVSFLGRSDFFLNMAVCADTVTMHLIDSGVLRRDAGGASICLF
jgi:hypothetical protein